MNTEEIRTTIELGLAELTSRVHADREAGRIVQAERMGTFCQAVSEYMRISENGLKANQISIAALEKK
jgi:hypothetical protein